MQLAAKPNKRLEQLQTSTNGVFYRALYLHWANARANNPSFKTDNVEIYSLPGDDHDMKIFIGDMLLSMKEIDTGYVSANHAKQQPALFCSLNGLYIPDTIYKKLDGTTMQEKTISYVLEFCRIWGLSKKIHELSIADHEDTIDDPVPVNHGTVWVLNTGPYAIGPLDMVYWSAPESGKSLSPCLEPDTRDWTPTERKLFPVPEDKAGFFDIDSLMTWLGDVGMSRAHIGPNKPIAGINDVYSKIELVTETTFQRAYFETLVDLFGNILQHLVQEQILGVVDVSLNNDDERRKRLAVLIGSLIVGRKSTEDRLRKHERVKKRMDKHKLGRKMGRSYRGAAPGEFMELFYNPN